MATYGKQIHLQWHHSLSCIYFSWENRHISGLMVSKAAMRSERTAQPHLRLSGAHRRQMKTLPVAVAKLWITNDAHCRSSCKSFAVKCLFNWSTATFSVMEYYCWDKPIILKRFFFHDPRTPFSSKSAAYGIFGKWWKVWCWEQTGNKRGRHWIKRVSFGVTFKNQNYSKSRLLLFMYTPTHTLQFASLQQTWISFN